MLLSAKLLAERAEHLTKMQALVDNATGKELTGDDATAFDAAEAAIKALDERIARQRAVEASQRNSDPARPRVAIDGEGNQHRILAPTERLFSRYEESAPSELIGPGTLGAALRGIAVGRWNGHAAVQRALSAGAGAAGGYTVPAVLAAQWLDMARNLSVMMTAGSGTIEMPNGNLTVAGIASDPVPTSKKENTSFPDSDPTFRAVNLKAHTYGVVVTSSAELLNDSPNAEQMIEASLLGAMALVFDAAAISGNGSTSGNLDNVRGLLNVVGLPETAAVGAPADYDPWLDAMAGVEAANHVPRTVLLNPGTNNTLRKLVTGLSGDLTKLVAPPDYAALQRLRSTNVPSTASIVGDFTKGTYGVVPGLTIEATREGSDSFKNYQVLIRAVLRFDYAPLYVGAFHRLVGIA